MNFAQIRDILEKLQKGELDLKEALTHLKDLPFENIRNTHIDHHRELRQGIPEVVFAQGKTKEEVISIARKLYERSGRVLITRANEEIYKALNISSAKFHSRSGVIMASEEKDKIGSVLIITAGTSDIPVAEEAQLTASFLGSNVKTVYDIGVAGIHRLFAYKELIQQANVIVVVAGMEGALPSVVGGLTDRVIIGVPTSRGYGTAFGGLTALMSMLNSCVPGIAVMNIDNGFGAGCLAHKINRGFSLKA